MTMPTLMAPPPDVSRQGNYAGAVTRLVAFAADVGASWGLFTLGLAGLTFAINLATGKQVNLASRQIIALVAIVIWEFIYFAYQWSLGGRTIGMALVGIQVVGADGDPIRPRQAVVRTVVLPFSFLFLGLGLIGIVLTKDRHAFHDRMAKTAVVYSWDARAARLRWLAKQEPAKQP